MATVDLYRKNSLKKKHSLNTETARTIRFLIITLTAMIVTLSVAFLFITSKSAQRGYSLEQEKQKYEALRTENNSITTRLTNSNSFTEIEDDEKVKMMDEISEKIYVTEEDNAI